MGAAGTTTPTGWFVGTGGNTAPAQTSTTVIAGTGSSTAGANYNFGVEGANSVTDRALGSLASASTQPDTEIDLTNNTGFDFTQFIVMYDGEQWRSGGANSVPNTLTLQISLTGAANSWVDLGAAFNFTSPINGQAPGALDGNLAANRVSNIGGMYTSASLIVNGSTFFLRFADPDDTSADNGIAVDNFSFQVVPEPSVYMLLGLGLLFCGQRFLRRRKTA